MKKQKPRFLFFPSICAPRFLSDETNNRDHVFQALTHIRLADFYALIFKEFYSIEIRETIHETIHETLNDGRGACP